VDFPYSEVSPVGTGATLIAHSAIAPVNPIRVGVDIYAVILALGDLV